MGFYAALYTLRAHTPPPQVLLAADVELGCNYPDRIITTEVCVCVCVCDCVCMRARAELSRPHPHHRSTWLCFRH